MPSFHNKKVGDFGCGYHASFTRTIVEEALQVTLVDVALSDELRNHKKIQAIECVLPDAFFSINTDTFDIVLCISVLEHLSDPLGALKEIWRILADQGVLLLNVPSWRGKRFLEFSAFKLGTSPAAEMNDHKMYYDLRDLWPILVQAGFLPSCLNLRYHKFGLNLFAVARKQAV